MSLHGNGTILVRVERATGPLRRATRPPLSVRQPSNIRFKHVRAEARRQVAAENGRVPVPVRLRRREDGAVEVRSCAVKSRAVSNRNCVAARRGGEHRNENDQSVTQACREASRRELRFGRRGRASLRVTGEACKAGDRREAEAPDSRVSPRSLRRWLETEWPEVAPAIIRETRRGQAVFMAKARRAARRESERP